VNFWASSSVIICDPETDSWTTGVELPESAGFGCRATVEHTGSTLVVNPPMRFEDGRWTEQEIGSAGVELQTCDRCECVESVFLG